MARIPAISNGLPVPSPIMTCSISFCEWFCEHGFYNDGPPCPRKCRQAKGHVRACDCEGHPDWRGIGQPPAAPDGSFPRGVRLCCSPCEYGYFHGLPGCGVRCERPQGHLRACDCYRHRGWSGAKQQDPPMPGDTQPYLPPAKRSCVDAAAAPHGMVWPHVITLPDDAVQQPPVPWTSEASDPGDPWGTEPSQYMAEPVLDNTRPRVRCDPLLAKLDKHIDEVLSDSTSDCSMKSAP